MNIDEKIEAKKKEIVNYERILEKNWGRWNNYGRRSLAKLKEELQELEKEKGPDGP
jgi:hypothetical protein